MRIHEITEAVVVPAKTSKTLPAALSDSDTVRVYHGANSIETIVLALTRGLTGDMRIYRRYSYENNNNPKGLFVTPDLDTAKEFGDYILEFHARVADLEAPVWPSGKFTVQGQNAEYFKSDSDREAARHAARELASRDSTDFVKLSSRPELAQLFLTGGERQALFTGNLNANSIRAVWISSDPTDVRSTFIRMSPAEFLKKYKARKINTRYGSVADPDDAKSDFYWNQTDKLVKPRDTVSADRLIAAVMREYPHLDREEVIDILKNNPDYLDRFLWSDSQKSEVSKQLQSL